MDPGDHAGIVGSPLRCSLSQEGPSHPLGDFGVAGAGMCPSRPFWVPTR